MVGVGICIGICVGVGAGIGRIWQHLTWQHPTASGIICDIWDHLAASQSTWQHLEAYGSIWAGSIRQQQKLVAGAKNDEQLITFKVFVKMQPKVIIAERC